MAQEFAWFLAKDGDETQLFKKFNGTVPIWTTVETEAHDYGTQSAAEAASFVGAHPVKRPK